jgi:hypothetical protein
VDSRCSSRDKFVHGLFQKEGSAAETRDLAGIVQQNQWVIASRDKGFAAGFRELWEGSGAAGARAAPRMPGGS